MGIAACLSVCQCQDGLPLSPAPLNSRAASIDHLLAAVNLAQSREDLGWRGSRADISQTPQINVKKKNRVTLSLSLFVSICMYGHSLRGAKEVNG